MEVIVKEGARQDLASLEEGLRDRVLDEIEKLEKNATPDNSTFVEVGDMELFRLKLQEEDRNSKLTHRVFYQIKDNKVYIRGIFHRHKGYGTETREELEERI
ncbi:MAG: type II toxin-antitoxin system RelE/ParE family toxin [Nanohaloarchaea archaeon]|nr:type II toxin-antitoxin system RelE/ParE family toxin [Candidatus Nanohaloarchaea archaeon]